MPSKPIYLTVLLYVKPEKEALFEKYESLVLPILNQYEGQLLYRLKVTGKPSESPYEIHLISFPDQSSFQAYKLDKKRVSYQHLFTESVEKVLLFEGKNLI